MIRGGVSYIKFNKAITLGGSARAGIESGGAADASLGLRLKLRYNWPQRQKGVTVRRLKMSLMICIALAFIGVTLNAETRNPQLSKESLSDEEIAIYREVLRDCVKDLRNEEIKLANKTIPLDLSSNECLKKFDFSETDIYKNPLIHELSISVTSNLNVVLVDGPDKQRQILGEYVRLGQDMEAAQAGFLTLSEILFDKERNHAFVSYWFNCGVLCGGGTTIILENNAGKWEISIKKCPRYVS
jgi:hypothetical protein